MLNGIGGATIEEAKQRISYVEFLSWIAYKNKRGSLNIGNRLESGFALIASILSKAHGGTSEMKDFMPHADEKVADVSDVMNLLSGKAK